MSPDSAIDIVREALILTLMVSGPILMVGLVIGLLVSVLQAVTQVQEQTLSFVPKIIGMALAAVVLVPWMGVKLMDFTVRMLGP